ncbi:MAG TPA: hypothetical protein VNB06_01115, partial [Thermoanaerobaculia bacterium]|nr:hypothetical protein [Thermoanaerobaculia bacterium]
MYIARLLYLEEVFELEPEAVQQLLARPSRGIAPPAGGELGEMAARQAEDLRPAIERQGTPRQLLGQSFVPETNPHVDFLDAPPGRRLRMHPKCWRESARDCSRPTAAYASEPS